MCNLKQVCLRLHNFTHVLYMNIGSDLIDVQRRGSGIPRVGNVRKKVGGCAIPAGTPPLTWNWGEYLRVVRIHSDG